ncbi:MAG: polysaccharide biosynthesis/export family protein, partial [Acidobacteriota bacterium]|nr:polysaccharide biosynthesis/export family protein [Acidobacteriota bacterium]
MKQKSFIFSQVLILFVCSICVFAQTPSDGIGEVNFGYSKNPPAKSVKRIVEKKTGESDAQNVAGKRIENNPAGAVDVRYQSIARMTREAVRDENLKSLKPTEIYKVGSGDVLFIGIQESRSNYYTVLTDGSIDYPLAGGLVPVEGLSPGEIENLLR